MCLFTEKVEVIKDVDESEEESGEDTDDEEEESDEEESDEEDDDSEESEEEKPKPKVHFISLIYSELSIRYLVNLVISSEDRKISYCT